jgi:DNA-binding LacI/PurR family transcriptional regulator
VYNIAMSNNNNAKDFSKQKKTTLSKIALELGVSAMTVSNAYNRPDQLSPQLRQRILEVADRLGFSGPDPAARSLRLGRAGAVGVLYTNRLSYAFADPAAVLFLEGVASAVEEAGLGLVLIPSQFPGKSFISQAVIDGFIIYSVPESDPSVKAALDRKLPIVLVDQIQPAGFASVGIDDRTASQGIVQHLLQLGHTNFAIVTMPLAPDGQSGMVDQARLEATAYQVTRARLAGCQTALVEAGIAWETVPIYECSVNTIEQGHVAAEKLLTSFGQPRPTALVALSDQLAIGVLEAAKQLGISIPREVSVVGFDDNPMAVRMTPSITTVYQPLVEKGRLAGRLLIAQLEGAKSSIIPNVLQTQLVIRESSNRVKAHLPR